MLNLKVSARWTRDDGQSVDLDQRLLQLLQAIQHEGSISLACKTMGVSYRTLWAQIQQYNQLLGEEVVATHGRAGACLTRFGHKLLWMVEQGQVRIAPELGTVGEQLNAEWLDADQNKPWISLAMSDDMVLQRLFNSTPLYKQLQMSLRWSGSIAALSALHRGEVRVAGCHLPVGQQEHSHVHQIMRRWLRGGNLSVVELFERDIGWMSRPSETPPTLGDVARNRALLVNRNSSSSTHHQLNALITQACLNPDDLPGYYHEENSHLAVACTIAAGHGDLGLGIRAAAMQYGLQFRPVSQDQYFLVLHTSDLAYPAMQVLLPWLSSNSVKDAVEQTPGYQASRLGQVHPLENYLYQLADRHTPHLRVS
ncbi:substrate-binding domain-containing protein [Limnobacter sp.]|uniref:substrate-binding domain-containing protein n=1 Tax=Limnobacter sp. TaxID=2003368 RepID=UPI0035171E02